MNAGRSDVPVKVLGGAALADVELSIPVAFEGPAYEADISMWGRPCLRADRWSSSERLMRLDEGDALGGA